MKLDPSDPLIQSIALGKVTAKARLLDWRTRADMSHHLRGTIVVRPQREQHDFEFRYWFKYDEYALLTVSQVGTFVLYIQIWETGSDGTPKEVTGFLRRNETWPFKVQP
jgi:hypothetical protein